MVCKPRDIAKISSDHDRGPRLGAPAESRLRHRRHGTKFSHGGATTVKHAMKRVHRVLRNTEVNLEVACGDLMQPWWATPAKSSSRWIGRIRKRKTGSSKPFASTLEPMDAPFPCSGRPYGRRIAKDGCTNTKRPCARKWPRYSGPDAIILLADRGFATVQFFRFLDGLGWDWGIRSKGHVLVRWNGAWNPLALLGKGRPVHQDGAVDYGKKAAGGSYTDP